MLESHVGQRLQRAFERNTNTVDFAGNFGRGGIGFCGHSHPRVQFGHSALDVRAVHAMSGPDSIAPMALALGGVLVTPRRGQAPQHSAQAMHALG